MAAIAVLLANGFEDDELQIPFRRLHNAGHSIVLVGVEAGAQLSGRNRRASVTIDTPAARLYPSSFDLVLIPGGYSPDRLRLHADIVSFLSGFNGTGRLIAAVSHGPSLLIEAEAVSGRMLTSAPAIRKDLENAGASWADQDVVVDDNLITARGPEDLSAFSTAIMTRLTPAGSGR